MLQIILALSFIAMILIPAVVAAFSGKKETEAAHDGLEAAAAPVRMAQPPQRKVESSRKVFQAATLPMHGTLGMAGR